MFFKISVANLILLSHITCRTTCGNAAVEEDAATRAPPTATPYVSLATNPLPTQRNHNLTTTPQSPTFADPTVQNRIPNTLSKMEIGKFQNADVRPSSGASCFRLACPEARRKRRRQNALDCYFKADRTERLGYASGNNKPALFTKILKSVLGTKITIQLFIWMVVN